MKFESVEHAERVLSQMANYFLEKNYDMSLDIPFIVNPRLKKRYGTFWHKRDRKESIKIEMSKTYIWNQPWSNVVSTLKHECIHYALYEKNLPYRDGDDYFENELVKHGSHSTGTVKFKGRVVEYKCSADGCDKVFQKKRKYPNNGKGYVSGCHNAPIIYVGEKEI